MIEKRTLVLPSYQQTRGMKFVESGVEFYSYRTGILRYIRISADGLCGFQANHGAATYCAFTLDGTLKNAKGKTIRFRTERAAARAAVTAANDLGR